MRPLAWSALRPDRTTYRYGDLTPSTTPIAGAQVGGPGADCPTIQ